MNWCAAERKRATGEERVVEQGKSIHVPLCGVATAMAYIEN